MCVRERVCPSVCTSEGVTLWPHFNYCTKCVCVCLIYIAALLFWGCFSPKALAVWLHMACAWGLACGFCPSGVRFLFPLIVCVCLHVCVCVCVCIQRDVLDRISMSSASCCSLLVSCVSCVMDRWKRVR